MLPCLHRKRPWPVFKTGRWPVIHFTSVVDLSVFTCAVWKRKHWNSGSIHSIVCWCVQQFPHICSTVISQGLCLFVCCLTSQQHAGVSQGRICSDNCTCCHTEIEVADPTFYLTQSQYPDIGPTSPSADPITPGAWQGSHWSANFWVTGMTRKNPGASGIRTRDLLLSRRTP